MRLLIIGGSDAGIAAGLRARELDPGVGATVVVADRYPNYSICGLPYHLSGDVPEWRSLAHRSRSDLEGAGLELLLDHTARSVDVAAMQVTVTTPAGTDQLLGYDRLVIATGAHPARPPIDGLDLDGVHELHTMGDVLAVQAAISTRQAGQPAGEVVLIGGGYIGLELAEAFTARGWAVTQVEQLPTVLATVDPPFGRLLTDELTRHGVRLRTGTTVTRIEQAAGGRLRVLGDPDLAVDTDLVMVVVGVAPNSTLAAKAGAALGVRGTIAVDRRMRTSLPEVWAAGDCVHTHHLLLDEPVWLPLGTTAHKQGRIAGENAVGGDRAFAGSAGTQVVKVFDLAVARSGLRDPDATQAGYDPVTVAVADYDHKVYYPGAEQVHVRLTGDRASGRLLGMQLLGAGSAQIAKRIDIAATGLHHGITVAAVADLDLSYTPPFGSPWDVVQLAAHAWTRQAAEAESHRAGGKPLSSHATRRRV